MLKIIRYSIFSSINFVALLFAFSLSSCTENPLDIDVSHVELELEVKAFEKELFQNEDKLTNDEIDAIAQNYQPFFDDFTNQIINIGDARRGDFNFQLNAFRTDPGIRDVYADVQKQFPNFSPYQKELAEAFKHYKYYFPNEKVPTIITYVSGFNYAIATGKDYLGIGLDMFLGTDYKAYAQLGLPQYKSMLMAPEYLVPSVLLGWVSTEFEMPITQPNLMEEMIHQGKIIYMLDALIPNEKDAKKINYSQEQFDWCENNRKEIWFYFMDNELLYTKENSQIIKFMGEAPFTQGFPEGSPGRIGHYLGWQIVKAYMKKNLEVTIPELMQEKDFQKILTKSKYKP
ncbi:MAG: hypothetical protein RQ875_05375 [Vicingaceae bacterium]|nr:hypothetical protein [Vicingaceae bacterium]